MKTLKQLREEYDSKYVPQNESPEEMVLEVKSKSLMKSDVPSVSQMPSLLLFRRVSYKLYPQNQVVALYYSKMVDKYLSVPFGPTGSLNLAESKVYDTLEDLEEGMAKTVAKTVAGGVSGAAKGAAKGFFRGAAVGADPGAAIGAVAGGVHGAYKGAKRAYEKSKDQDVKESFRERYSELKEGWRETLSDIGKSMPGYGDKEESKRRWKKGDYLGAATSQAKALGKAALTGLGVAATGGVAGAGLRALGGAAMTGGAMELAKKGIENVTKSSGGSNEVRTQSKAASTELMRDKTTSTTKSSWKKASDPVLQSRLKAAELKQLQMKENKISDLRDMISEGTDNMNIDINGKSVTLNTSMAKRILEVYDSVNTKNKKIVESMLNEDLESFKKLLNFSIRK